MSPVAHEFIFGVKLGTSALKTLSPVIKHEAIKLSSAVKPTVQKSLLFAAKYPKFSTSFGTVTTGGIGYHMVGYSHYHQVRKVTQKIYDKHSLEIDKLSDKIVESKTPTLKKDELLEAVKMAREELELTHEIQDNSDYGCTVLRSGDPNPTRFHDSSKELVQTLKDTVGDLL